MSSTARFALPLVAAAQSQKHVTVNEAFERIDALSQLTLKSVSQVTPPGAPSDGDVYAVPTGAVNEWSAEVGKLAVFLNGGWAFVDARMGWSAWIEDQGAPARYTGSGWVIGAQGLSANGATFALETLETDITIGAGSTFSTAPILPAYACVFALTGVVTSSVTGSLSSWSIGVTGSSDRYGSGLGLSQGSWFRGVTGAPQTYYADTALLLSADGGDFDGGTVRVAVHFASFSLPSV